MNVLGNYMTIEQLNDPVGFFSIIGRVCYHNDSGSLFIQFSQQSLHFITVSCDKA